MSPDAISIPGMLAVLLPTIFLISLADFSSRKFEDPIVTKLFRDLLSFHFSLVGIGSILGVSTLALPAGRSSPSALPWSGHWPSQPASGFCSGW